MNTTMNTVVVCLANTGVASLSEKVSRRAVNKLETFLPPPIPNTNQSRKFLAVCLASRPNSLCFPPNSRENLGAAHASYEDMLLLLLSEAIKKWEVIIRSFQGAGHNSVIWYIYVRPLKCSSLGAGALNIKFNLFEKTFLHCLNNTDMGIHT